MKLLPAPSRPLLTPRVLAALLLLCAAPALQAQPVFSAAQAEAGAAVYKETCQLCHGTTLGNGQFGTPLRGNYFRKKWGGKSVGELLQFTQESMPPDNKGGLAPGQYAAAIAYILSRNDIAAGSADMPADPAQLSAVPLPWPAP